MTFAEASRFVITFRQYKGKILDEIASTDEGLLWLHGLRKQRFDAIAKSSELGRALAAYLDDPSVAVVLERLVSK